MIQQDVPLFAKWCHENGIQVRAGKGAFERLQILVPGDKHGWARIWSNATNDKLKPEARIRHIVDGWLASRPELPLLQHCEVTR